MNPTDPTNPQPAQPAAPAPTPAPAQTPAQPATPATNPLPNQPAQPAAARPPHNLPHRTAGKSIHEMSPHRLEAMNRLSPIGKRLFPYIEFDDNEELVAEVRKHPIGVISSLVIGGIVILIMIILTAVLTANVDKISFGLDSGTLKNIITFVGLILTLFSATTTYISAYVYRSSVLFITSEKIAEVSYKSLFNRSITQLGIGNVEDVTYHQQGILPRIFHYGTLTVETAGAEENTVFEYVPDPNTNTQLIIKMHEDYVEKFGN